MPLETDPKASSQRADKVYVANYGSDNVSVLDTQSPRLLTGLTYVGNEPVDPTMPS